MAYVLSFFLFSFSLDFHASLRGSEAPATVVQRTICAASPAGARGLELFPILRSQRTSAAIERAKGCAGAASRSAASCIRWLQRLAAERILNGGPALFSVDPRVLFRFCTWR